jgi:peptide methionine sulfoxide reductase MsrB
LRQQATEPPGYSERTPGELEFELKKNFGSKYPKEGVYDCVGCGTSLYKADSKFDSGCGWPAYFQGIYKCHTIIIIIIIIIFKDYLEQ